MRERDRQGEGRGQDRWNLKYAAGGLVDIEFIAQYLQLVHGATTPEILDTSTIRVLDKAWRLGLLPTEDAEVLRPAVRLYHNLTQILRLCLPGEFDPKTAARRACADCWRAPPTSPTSRRSKPSSRRRRPRCARASRRLSGRRTRACTHKTRSRGPLVDAHLAEFGIDAPVGRNGVEQLLGVVADASDKRLPEVARACVAALGVQLRVLKAQILEFDRMISAWHRSNETSRRLDEAPGIGPVLATALVATVADPKTFRSGRNFRPGLGWCRSSIRAGARTGSAISASKATLSARPVRGRCARRHPLCQNPRHQTSALAHGIVGAAANQDRRHRACQQDRQDGLGDDGYALSKRRYKRPAAGLPARPA